MLIAALLVIVKYGNKSTEQMNDKEAMLLSTQCITIQPLEQMRS